MDASGALVRYRAPLEEFFDTEEQVLLAYTTPLGEAAEDSFDRSFFREVGVAEEAHQSLFSNWFASQLRALELVAAVEPESERAAARWPARPSGRGVAPPPGSSGRAGSPRSSDAAREGGRKAGGSPKKVDAASQDPRSDAEASPPKAAAARAKSVGAVLFDVAASRLDLSRNAAASGREPAALRARSEGDRAAKEPRAAASVRPQREEPKRAADVAAKLKSAQAAETN